MSTVTFYVNGDGDKLVEVSSSDDEVSTGVTHVDEIHELSGKSRRDLARMYMAGEIDKATFEAWVRGE